MTYSFFNVYSFLQFVLEPQSDSRDKLVASIRRRAGYGEEKMILCSNRLQALGLAEKTYRYHKECYKEITNKTKIERIKKSFEKFQGNSSNVKDEQNETVKQRPKVQDKRNMRSQGVVFNKDRCIFCQEQDGIIHKVAYLTTGAKMLDVAEKLQDIPLLLRLNNIPNASDAIANDVQYHRKCWVMAQRKSKVKESTPQELDDVNRVVADIEINNIVESLLKGSVDAVMDIKSLNTTYNDLLGTDDVNYKRYLKQLLLENVPGVTFVRPPARNESERICSSRSQSNSVEKTFQSSYDDYKSIFQAAKVIRKEIKAQERWQFNGSFDGFTVPKSLKLMLKWIIIGPTTIHASADEEIDRCVDVLSELVINMMKSDRQIQHSNKRNNNGYRKMNETPLTVGLGLHLYKSTRSKVLIEHMSNLGLCISYDKVLKIENAIANAVSAKMETSNGVYIPPNVVPGVPVHFAIDNCDFKNDTPDGKNEFHATAQVIIQKSISSNFPPLLLIDRCVEKFKENTIITEKISKPSILNETFPNFDGKISCIEQNDCNELDRTWALCQVMDEEISGVLPTWPAFNSLISLKPIVSTCQILPLYPSSPTDWSTLYTSLKIVQNINVEVTKNNKTIVSFDLQLYSKAMQLRSRPEIREGFVFRLGELHTVFAMLRVIGKYIEESGLDRIFVDSGMYGENTLKQILGGKHMKRSIEAHTTMYLALLRILLFDWYNESKDNKETMDNLKNQHAKQTSLVDMQDNVKLLKNIFKEHGILNKIFNFGDTLEHQGRFFRNYMRMFENLLLFIRASRDGLWMLHLSSMNDFAKYFFAHDQLNYARLTPMYLADMLQLEQSDNETWNYLKGNFSVGKSDIPFTSIGSDHAIEQENKNLKVNGGITGLTQTHSVLTRFCMVAPVLSSLSDEYRLKYDIQHPAKRKTHYQLTGSHLKRLSENVNKLKVEMEKYDVTFTRNNSVFNVVSKAVLPEEAATELLEHNSIGKKMYDEFITLRIQGGKQIWDKMAKRKLKTFKSHLAVIKKKVDGKVIQLREEKSLLSRFLLTSRKRPEIDLERCLGNFEFSIIPRSLFTSDGEPLACTDKSKVLHCIEELGSLHEDEDQPESNRIETSVLVIDSMAVLNQIHKDKDMETCKVCFFLYTVEMKKV